MRFSNFIPELDALFSEVSRILRKTGIWAFIVEENTNQRNAKFIEKPKGKNGLVNYQHSSKYLLSLMKDNDFFLLKKLEFVAENFQMEGKAVSFQVYVTEKKITMPLQPTRGAIGFPKALSFRKNLAFTTCLAVYPGRLDSTLCTKEDYTCIAENIYE